MAKTAFQPLTDFETNTYSQYGEDGVVTELLRRIASATSLDKWCVEFGAGTACIFQTPPACCAKMAMPPF